MKRQSYRYQRTLAGPAEVRGVGFLTGATVRARFLPAPAGAGVVFVRTDCRPRTYVPAHISQVTGTNRRTTLGRPPAQVGLVEHVLAALAGLRIDNCLVELNAPEPPGLDGSARAFVDALLTAGTKLQTARRPIYAVEETTIVAAGGATLALHPADGGDLVISYFLDYGLESPIARQVHTETITPASFANEISACRTFILESEADTLRQQGLGSRTTPNDLLVFGPHGPIDNRLRYANEPARHKILDIIGDLSLLGADLCGHVTAYRSGHPLTTTLARVLYEQLSASCGCRAALAA